LADDALVYYLKTVGCDAVTAAAVVRGCTSGDKACRRTDADEKVPVAARVTDAPASDIAVAAEAAADQGVDLPQPDGEGHDVEASWEALAMQAAGCTACDLASGRTQTVFGSGALAADLLLIGEAPGRDEDAQGEPFVGRAGQLLNRMLVAIGLARSQVQVINVVKCRPPQNRDPRPQEIAACRHFIDDQIALIRPKVIVLLGRVATGAMLGKDAPLSVLRYQSHQVQGIPAFVTYHPAFLLRTPQKKAEGWRDLLQIRQRLMAEGAN